MAVIRSTATIALGLGTIAFDPIGIAIVLSCDPIYWSTIKISLTDSNFGVDYYKRIRLCEDTRGGSVDVGITHTVQWVGVSSYKGYVLATYPLLKTVCEGSKRFVARGGVCHSEVKDGKIQNRKQTQQRVL
jgi:hypothetical protein